MLATEATDPVMRTLPASSAPVHSMTGFARISGRVSDGLGYTLSLKSVNHRFLDLHLRMPSGQMRLKCGCAGFSSSRFSAATWK